MTVNGEKDGSSTDFTPPVRVESYLTSKTERQVLNRICAALPAWMTPDRLTALGFLGAALSGASYCAAHWSPWFLWLSSLGMLLNWFGDSLDGSVARFRKIERPRYGYFIDHSFDVINYACIFIGIGFSPYVPMSAALFGLTGILLMHVYTLMSGHLEEDYNAVFFSLGPTELRLVFIYLNTAMFFRGPLKWGFLGISFSPFAVGVAAIGEIGRASCRERVSSPV